MSTNEIDVLIREKRVYFVGEKLPSDWYEAFRLWLPLAEAGDAKAQYSIGRCYGNGDGVDKDKQQELAWYLKAAAQNEPRSHFNLHLCYENDNDAAQAKSWLDKAVELGESRACVGVAKAALAQGDKERAKQLFKQSADAGNEEGERGLFVCNLVLSNIEIKIMREVYMSRPEKWVKFTVKNESAIGATVVFDCRELESSDVNSKFLRYSSTIEHRIEPWSSDNVTLGLTPNQNYVLFGVKILHERKAGQAVLLNATNGGLHATAESSYFAVKPRLLWEKSGSGPCFVLTACYEDFDAPTVWQFRQFRDNHLTRFRLGKAFIAWYYTHGPKMAQAISDKPRTKAVFRRVFNAIAKFLP